MILHALVLVGEGFLRSGSVLCDKEQQEQATLQSRTNQEQPQHRLCPHQSTGPSQHNRLGRIRLLITGSINSSTCREVVNEVQGPSRESSQKQQGTEPDRSVKQATA